MEDSVVPYGSNNGQVASNYGEHMSEMEKINAMLQFVAQIGNGMDSLKAFCEQNAEKVGFLYQLTEKEIGALRAEWGAESMEIKQWMNQVASRIQGAEHNASLNHREIEIVAARFSSLYEAQQETIRQQEEINTQLTSTLTSTVTTFSNKAADLAGNIETIKSENKKKTAELRTFRATLRNDLSARPTFDAVTKFVDETMRTNTEGMIGLLEETKESLCEEVEEAREKIMEIQKGVQEAKELEKRVAAFEQLLRVEKKDNVTGRKEFERRLKECNAELTAIKDKTVYLAKRLSQERTDANGKDEEIMSRVEQFVGELVEERFQQMSQQMMASLNESQRENKEALELAMRTQEQMMTAWMKKMNEQIAALGRCQNEKSPIPMNPNFPDGGFTAHFAANFNNDMHQTVNQKTKDQEHKAAEKRTSLSDREGSRASEFQRLKKKDPFFKRRDDETSIELIDQNSSEGYRAVENAKNELTEKGWMDTSTTDRWAMGREIARCLEWIEPYGYPYAEKSQTMNHLHNNIKAVVSLLMRKDREQISEGILDLYTSFNKKTKMVIPQAVDKLILNGSIQELAEVLVCLKIEERTNGPAATEGNEAKIWETRVKAHRMLKRARYNVDEKVAQHVFEAQAMGTRAVEVSYREKIMKIVMDSEIDCRTNF